jgi:uroporphyrinogen decarboxylase
MNKRDAVLSLLDDSGPQTYIPAAFFLHFDPSYHRGQAAIDQHLAYFQATDMDILKVQYEHTFPQIPEIRGAADWSKMPLYDETFFAEPLAVVDGLVKAAKDEALVLVTLYSPFMCAGHATSDGTITDHLKENPESVKPGLEIVTESLMVFVKGCIERGVDGFYMSTQGGEAARFEDKSIFEQYVKPTDLVLMEEIDRTCAFSILHVCDYHDPYNDLSTYLDYPGDVVNCSQQVGDTWLSWQEIMDLFGRPFMGGLDRHGVLATGDAPAIGQRVNEILADAPARFMLGADCTLPSDTDWANIRAAIDTAHAYG